MASKKLSVNHYALPKERKYFQLHRVGLALTAVGIALISIGIGIALTSGIKGWLYQDTISETRLIEQKYKAKFNQLSETLVDSTTSTASMQNVVQTVDTLEKKYLHDPEELLALISNDISLFSDIRVKNISWFVTNYSDSKNYADVRWGKTKKRRKKRRVDKTAKKAPKAKKGYFEIALVEGEFIDFDGNYRYALSAVDDLERAMSDSDKYYSVEITKRPLDIESDNRLSGDVSTDRSNNQDRAEIAMRIVREVPRSE